MQDELREQLTEKETENMRLKNNLESLQERFDYEISELHSVINDYEKKSNKQASTAEINRFKKELKVFKKEAKDVYNSLQEIYNKSCESYRQKVFKLEQQSNVYQSDLVDLQRTIHELEHQVSNNVEKTEQLNKSIEFYKNISVEQADALKKAGSEKYQTEIENVQLRTELKNREIDFNYQIKIYSDKSQHYDNKIRTMQEVIDSLTHEKHSLHEDYKTLHSLIKESEEERQLRSQNIQLKVQLEESQAESKKYQNEVLQTKEYSKKTQEDLFSLQSLFTSQKKEKELVMAQMNMKDREITSLKSDCNKLKEEIFELQEKAYELPKFEKVEYSTSKFTDKTSDNILEYENEVLRRDLETEKLSKNNLEQALSVQKEELNTIKREKEMLELQKKQLERELNDSYDSNQMLRSIRTSGFKKQPKVKFAPENNTEHPM